MRCITKVDAILTFETPVQGSIFKVFNADVCKSQSTSFALHINFIAKINLANNMNVSGTTKCGNKCNKSN